MSNTKAMDTPLTKLIQRLASLPLSTQITLCCVFVSFISVSSISLLSTYYYWLDARQSMLEKANEIGKEIAEQGKTAVAFTNYNRANNLLSTLTTHPSIQHAIIYSKSGHIIASYHHQANENIFSISQKFRLSEQSKQFIEQFLLVKHNISYQGKVIGQVILASHHSVIMEKLQQMLSISLLFISCFTAVSYVLSQLLLRIINTPLHHLTRIINKIPQTHNYQFRIPCPDINGHDDAIVQLSAAINQLFAQLEEDEHRLLDHQQQINTLIEHIPDAVYICDTNGKIQQANHNASVSLDYSIEQLQNMNFSQFDSEIENAYPAQHGWHKLRLGQKTKIFSKFTRQNNQSFPVQLYSTLIKIQSRPLILCIVRDISDKKLAQAALQQAYQEQDIRVNERTQALRQQLIELEQKNQQLQQTNKDKSAFFANMSNEILTPMISIHGFNKLLLNTPLDHKQQSYVNAIHHSAKDLMVILNNLLDIAKIAADQLQIERRPIHLASFLTEVRDEFEPQARQKGLKLQVETSANLQLIIDPIRVKQILTNFIINSIKFTDKGQIMIQITVKPRAEQSSTRLVDVEFTVSDTGIGIEKEQIALIFSQFKHNQRQSAKRYGGTGLGLLICDQLAKIMNGQINLKSQIGKGATFTLHLAAVEALQLNSEATNETTEKIVQPKSTTRSKTQGAKVLIVDDIAANRTLIMQKFIQSNIEFIEAEDGLQAIAQAKQHLPDLIFMDIRMPHVDGFEANRRLKQDTKTAKIPVIALTASIGQSELQSKQFKHFSDHLVKPASTKAMIDIFMRYLAFDNSKQQPRTQLNPSV